MGPIDRLIIIGVDPGLVDTGYAAMVFHRDGRMPEVTYAQIEGASIEDVRQHINDTLARVTLTSPSPIGQGRDEVMVVVEEYRDRGTSFSTHKPMREFDSDIRKERFKYRGKTVKPVLQDNSGVRSIITRRLWADLLQLPVPPATNHQDIQAAIRIGLYAAVKNEEYNSFLYNHITLGTGDTQ